MDPSVALGYAEDWRISGLLERSIENRNERKKVAEFRKTLNREKISEIRKRIRDNPIKELTK